MSINEFVRALLDRGYSRFVIDVIDDAHTRVLVMGKQHGTTIEPVIGGDAETACQTMIGLIDGDASARAAADEARQGRMAANRAAREKDDPRSPQNLADREAARALALEARKKKAEAENPETK